MRIFERDFYCIILCQEHNVCCNSWDAVHGVSLLLAVKCTFQTLTFSHWRLADVLRPDFHVLVVGTFWPTALLVKVIPAEITLTRSARDTQRVETPLTAFFKWVWLLAVHIHLLSASWLTRDSRSIVSLSKACPVFFANNLNACDFKKILRTDDQQPWT